MRVLVTGGAGFIGGHLCRQFSSEVAVRVLDDLSTGSSDHLPPGVEFINGSILDRAVVRSAMHDVDYVYHLAAMVSVPLSVAQPLACVETNVLGTLNILEAAAEQKVRKLCFASSAAVYGNNPTTPATEDLSPDPRSPYAVTKLDGEWYCRQFTDAGRLETVALRFFNVFGPRQNPNASYAAAVPIFFRRAISGEPLTIFGDGEQTRDFIYVTDVAAALVFATNTTGLTGVFNTGYGRVTTITDLARKVIALTGSRSPMHFAPERPGDVRHSCADITRLQTAGFQPTGTLDGGLLETYRKMRSPGASNPDAQRTPRFVPPTGTPDFPRSA
jgi:UDP-glucose 4-epimerase